MSVYYQDIVKRELSLSFFAGFEKLYFGICDAQPSAEKDFGGGCFFYPSEGQSANIVFTASLPIRQLSTIMAIALWSREHYAVTIAPVLLAPKKYCRSGT